jgi:hypothetical protein
VNAELARKASETLEEENKRLREDLKAQRDDNQILRERVRWLEDGSSKVQFSLFSRIQ